MPTSQKKYPNGINLITYIRGQTGSAQGARHVAEILQYSGIDFTILDFEPTELWEYNDHTWEHKIGEKAIYNINLFHVNPPELPIVLAHVGHEILQDRYNIAFCLWELERLPAHWIPPLDMFDEIWTPSDFTGISFRTDTKKPVYTMPYALTTPPCKPSIGREHFMLPADKVLFLCMYDCLSTIGRKNPLGVIKAYKKAFSPKDDNVGLVVKLNNAKQEDLNTIQKHFDKSWNVYIISEILHKEEINSLIKCVDVYVSLHRSEGFGLVCAEAMLLGKPVIATNWSSNTEFMDEDVACMVDYSLVTIKEQTGPYPAGHRWAEPDLSQASEYMRELYENKNYRVKLAKRARAHIEKKLSPEHISKIYLSRIATILEGTRLSNQNHNDIDKQKWSDKKMGENTAVNVEQIMDEIRAKIAEKGYVDDAIPFDTIKIKSNVAAQYNSHEEGSITHDFRHNLQALEYWRNDTEQLRHVNYYRSVQNRRRLVGNFLTFFRRVIRRLLRFLVEPIVAEQNAFNDSVAATVNNVYNTTVSTLHYMDIARNELIGTKHELSTTQNELSAIRNELSATRNELNTTQNELIGTKHELSTTQQALERTAQFLDNEKAALQAAMNDMYTQIDNSEMQVVKALKNYTTPPNAPSVTQTPNDASVANGGDIYDTIDYFDFENHFRGTRHNIKKIQEDYISYFKGNGRVIDLGCGRGEFLELLKKNNFDYIGVDLHDEFVLYCQMKNLNAIKSDAVQYLHDLEDESIGGIFSAHLVEHLETSQLVSLCRRSYEVLKPGGCIIIETPNPTCAATFINGFYLDPSHIKPVHPLTLEYLLKRAGFSGVEIIFTEHSRFNYLLPHLEGDNIHNLEDFNKGINNITNVLYGSMDYAIIARK